MTEIFPSIIPEPNRVDPLEVHDEWGYNVLRKVIAEHETDEVNGRSAQLEMADWITGQYEREDLARLREAGQADTETDTDENKHIKETLQTLE